MNQRSSLIVFCFASALVGGIVATQSAKAGIIIDTVPVGNPGNAADTAIHSGNPAGQGSVGYNYNIGKYEVTAGQYTAFLNRVAATDTYGLYNTSMSRTDYGSGITRSGASGSYTYSVNAAFVNRPVNFVSWGDSARFANWLHNGQPTGAQDLSTTEDGAYYLNGATSGAALLAVNRESDWRWAITSEDEWYKAAYYNPAASNYYDYPTSSYSVPGQDLSDVSGNNANYYGESYPIQSPYYTTVIGEFQNSDSPYGTFDQGGNVWEWNEALLFASARGLRGGAFNQNDDYLYALSRYYLYPTDEYAYFLGFRVSELPEPTSMALLAFGVLGMTVTRRGKRI